MPKATPAPEETPAPETKRESKAKTADDGGNGSGEKAVTEKPEGRLLPWEPVHPPVEVKPEPAPEPRRESESGEAEKEAPRD